MIQAKETYKEELSKHVEGIFKKYVKPGLHICDIATGGGKSYTIGKLTCEYYPKHFDRIVILCVQNKLVEGMNREIDRFIDLQDSLIKEDQKLVIENNTEVIKKAIIKEGITDNTRYSGGVKPGVVKYKDQDGDGKITTADRTVIGNAMPKWFGGITNTLEYKGIDFSFMFQFNYGNDIYNATRLYATQSRSSRRNMLAEVADRWSPTNASNLVPSYDGYITNDVYSRFVEDGSFLRLKNITLGYTLPQKWTSKFYVSKLRVYATGQNLFCWNNYSGYDPEVNSLNDPMRPGLDWGAYPKSRVFTFGIDLQF